MSERPIHLACKSGQPIDFACKTVADLACLTGRPVLFRLNGVEMRADPGCIWWRLVQVYGDKVPS